LNESEILSFISKTVAAAASCFMNVSAARREEKFESAWKRMEQQEQHNEIKKRQRKEEEGEEKKERQEERPQKAQRHENEIDISSGLDYSTASIYII